MMNSLSARNICFDIEKRGNHHSRRFFLKIAGVLSASMAFGSSHTEGPNREADLQFLKSSMANKSPLIWLFTGDSITQGAKHTHGWRSYPEVFAERIRWELGRSRDVIINTAVSGNTTADLLADWEWRIGHFKPQVVSVMMGTNDCAISKNIDLADYKNNLSTIVRRVREVGAIPVLHMPTPIVVDKAPERSRLPAYVGAALEVAEQSGVILVDHWTYWQEKIRQKSQSHVFSNWLNDPLHPNGVGHLEMARLLFKCIQIFDEHAATCGAPYYQGDR